MNRLGLAAAAALLSAAGGCPAPQETVGLRAVPRIVAEARGLEVSLVLPKYSFYRGEEIPLKVAVRNTTRRDVVITAHSGALAYVGLWQLRPERQILRFPQAAILVVKQWTLPAGESRSFPLNLQVTPDWPTGELMRLMAEINGWPLARPSALIDVYSTRQAYQRATRDPRE